MAIYIISSAVATERAKDVGTIFQVPEQLCMFYRGAVLNLEDLNGCFF